MKNIYRYSITAIFFFAFFICAYGQRIELKKGWRMISDITSPGIGETISKPDYDASKWYQIVNFPATVLAVLDENKVYADDLFYGANMGLLPDLWKEQWWYRNEFQAEEGRDQYWLYLRGISYRADVFLNGVKIGAHQRNQGLPAIIGQYRHFRLNVTEQIIKGGTNVLAIKIYPEQRGTADDDIVELAESWPDNGGLVKDHSAGIWLPVYLETSGDVQIRNPYAITDLPLPSTSSVDITVYSDVVNASSKPINGTLFGAIKREGKTVISFEKDISLSANEIKEISFTPDEFAQLDDFENPDLWWPYTLGNPNLYELRLEFKINDVSSDIQKINFGVREVTKEIAPIGKTGSQILRVNGTKLLVEGACISPDLLFRMGQNKEKIFMKYAKDLRLNLLRFEAHMGSETYYDLADTEGMPSVYGWMCCNQWEHWDKWDDEDHWVARESLKDQLLDLRSRPSTFQWLHGSDGTPPESVLNDYQAIADSLHFQDPTAKNAWGDGSVMLGPYSWAPPYYWFNDNHDTDPDETSYTFCWEQGNNEVIPPFETFKKYMPKEHWWPVDSLWVMHASSWGGSAEVKNIQMAINARYGQIKGIEDFCKKAQLINYENNRAQMESIAARGWEKRTGSVFWMLNNHYPGTFAHLFDYYLKPGGAYFGAKDGLKPINIVYNYYAEGNRDKAKIFISNQSLEDLKNLKAIVKIYNFDLTEKFTKEVSGINVASSSSTTAMEFERIEGLSSTYFIRCWLTDESDRILAENFYWDSPKLDVLKKYIEMDSQFKQYADLTALNDLPPVKLEVDAASSELNNEVITKIKLTNTTEALAFFVRVEVTKGEDGEEALPIFYNDNYVSLFPGESTNITARLNSTDLEGEKPYIRVEGYNVGKAILPIH